MFVYVKSIEEAAEQTDFQLAIVCIVLMLTVIAMFMF